MLHLAMADGGWVFRYEAYLVALGIVAAAMALSEHSSSVDSQAAKILIVALPTALFGIRAARAAAELPRDSRAIYLQQYQTARFLHSYYEGSSIAANDVGAINFFADVRCTDLIGPGNRDVFFARRTSTYTTSFS